jgi:hypothetical protein
MWAHTVTKMICTHLLHILALVELMGKFAAQDSCSTADLMGAADIVAICCESAQGSCADEFPATCAHT